MTMEEIFVNVDITYGKKKLLDSKKIVLRKYYLRRCPVQSAETGGRVGKQVQYITLAMITDLQSAVTGHLPLGNSKYSNTSANE